MAKYRLTDSGVFDTEQEHSIPNAPGNIHWDAYQVWLADGNTPDPIWVPIPIPVTKDDAKKSIDDSAETARLRYITGGSGQALTYEQKGEEAADYVAAGYPAMGSPPEYPFVNADAIAYGITHTEAADQIITLKSFWTMAGVQIEQHRLSGKVAVEAAVNEAAIVAARDAAIAELDLI